MKRMMLVWVMILCLVPVLSLAEQALASKDLFPAEGENGKWGYVDRDGAFVIQPMFDHAFGFRGNYVEVVVFPSDDAVNLLSGDRNPYYCGYSGIIDRNGEFILEPIYTIAPGYDQMFFGGRDTGIWCISAGYVDEENQLEGWFDIESGYFSGLVWDGVYGWVSDSPLIPVVDDTFRAGYANRRTGELVIPCRYQCVDPSPFYGGIASVSLEEEEFDETGNRTVSSYFLIDETGAEIPLPEGVFAVPYEGAHDGLILVANQADASTFVPDEGVLFGYADVRGNLVIKQQFISAHPFSDGLAAVRFSEGDWGYINSMGFVLERGLTEEPQEDEYEDELGFDTDEDDEDEDDNDEDFYEENGSSPLRDLDIVPGEDGHDHLQITMHDGSGQVFFTHALPPFASFDEYHAGNESILMDYPVMEYQYENWDDAGEAETIFLTVQFIDGDWKITNATNGRDWIAETENGVWCFDDWYANDEQSWRWENPGEDRLTEIDFETIEMMVSLFNEARPDRPNLPEAKDREH